MSHSLGLTASRYLDHLRSNGSQVDDLSSSALLALHPAATLGQRRATRPSGPFASVERGRRSSIDVVAPIGPGAAVAAVTLEFLACLGVKRVVCVGVAGWVDDESAGPADSLRLGDYAVVHSATGANDLVEAYGGVRDAADSNSLKAALRAPSVPAHTTSTPFRLGPGRFGVVEMEAAALFSSGAGLGLAVDLAVTISDVRATDGSWMALEPQHLSNAVGQLGQRLLDWMDTSE